MRASWKLGLTQLHGSSAGLLCRLGCNTMVSSVQQIATRAFVSVLVVLARSYDVALAVSRDSSAEDLLKAYRRQLSGETLQFRAWFHAHFWEHPGNALQFFFGGKPFRGQGTGDRVICNLRLQVTPDQGLTSFLYHESCASTRRPDLIGLWMLRCLVDCRFLDLG